MFLWLDGVVLDVGNDVTWLFNDCTEICILTPSKLKSCCDEERLCRSYAIDSHQCFDAVFCIAVINRPDHFSSQLLDVHFLSTASQNEHDKFLIAWKFHAIAEHEFTYVRFLPFNLFKDSLLFVVHAYIIELNL